MGVADEAACPGWLLWVWQMKLPALVGVMFDDIVGTDGFRNCFAGTVFQELMLSFRN